MNSLTLDELTAFIVRAKAATYVGDGAPSPACRSGSHDLQYRDGDVGYLDSYFGGSDFIGEEVVYFQARPVWAMNYYGRILVPDQITAAEAGRVIKASLTELYKMGRFLGGFQHSVEGFTYFDTNTGDASAFTGQEWITRAGTRVYELVYHGGLIRD